MVRLTRAGSYLPAIAGVEGRSRLSRPLTQKSEGVDELGRVLQQSSKVKL